MISAFVQNVSAHVEGDSNIQGLLQAIRPAQAEFKKAIRATAPDFRTARDDLHGYDAGALPCFLSHEEDPAVLSQTEQAHVYATSLGQGALAASQPSGMVTGMATSL